MKRISLICILVAVIMTMTIVLAACKDDVKTPNPVSPVVETEEHKYQGGVHKVNVSLTENDLIADGKTDYVVVIPPNADADTNKAAMLIRKHFASSTGATVTVTEDANVTYSADAKFIAVGSSKLIQAANLSVPYGEIGPNGYYVKTIGKSVFIAANSGKGLINGVCGFLSAALGYEMYADDTVTYTVQNASVKLPDCDVTERPDFDYHYCSNQTSDEGLTGMGFDSDIFIPVGGAVWHNSFKYLDPDIHAKSHPNWFSSDQTQLCYTAGGTEGALDEMLDEFMKTMIAAVEEYPDRDNVTITIEDINTACNCAACQKLYDKYGTDSAAVIMFCNKVAERLDKYFEKKVEGTNETPRKVNVLFFAYFKTTQPPAKAVNGNYVPIDDEVICRDNVGVYIAPISAAYNASFYEDVNKSTAEAIKGWAALSNKLYMWLYETNYSPSNQGNVTAFGKLKEYFNSKAMWNVNLDYSQICDDFFNAYFQDAAEPMRKYFEELQLQLKYIEANYPEINGGIYNNIAQARFWPKRLLDQWSEYLDEAYAAVDKYKDSDPALYGTLKEHIDIESIFIRFALISLHSGNYSAETLAQMRNDFKNDCTALHITMYSEKLPLSNIYLGWN